MAFDSLDDFLAILDDNGQLLKITDGVAPERDLGAAGRAVNDLGENPPLFFSTCSSSCRLSA